MQALDTNELQSISDKLASFDARCEAIMALLGDKRHLAREGRAHVEELYRSLKDDLKRAATAGTVGCAKRADGRRRALLCAGGSGRGSGTCARRQFQPDHLQLVLGAL